jgi:hypothetical protein
LQVSVQTNTPDLFKKHWKEQFVCLSLDGGSNACFPIFGLLMMPRIVNATSGTHTLVGRVTHPDNGDLIDGSSSGARTFRSISSANAIGAPEDEEFQDL